MDLKFDAQGLIPAVCQDYLDGSIRMVAWMNQPAVEATLRLGKATFYSRSRQSLWTKGETSGHSLHLVSMHADCDADTLLLRVRAEGPSCHTGRPTCFFSEYPSAAASLPPPPTFLDALERELELRQQSTSQKSYTKALLEAGVPKIREKLLEESQEFTHALEAESDERVASEAADILYHLLVGLRFRGVTLRQVTEQLAARSKMSGHEEKSQRGANSQT